MKRRALLALAPVSIGALYFGPPWARDYLKRGVHVEIEEALVRQKPGRARSGLRGIADKLGAAVGAALADEIHVRLRVRNETPLPARIRGARYLVRIGGRRIGEGVWAAPGGSQWFLSGRDVAIVAVLDPDWAALAGAGIDAASGRAAPISASGELTVALGGAGFAVPFEVSRVGWTRQAGR